MLDWKNDSNYTKGRPVLTETLLINFLFILFPVLIYLIFFENRITLYLNNTIIVLLASFPLILTMTFPIRLDLGFIYDLRYIPFIVASLFLGFKGAIPLYLVLNVYRFIIGGEGVYQSFFFSTVILLFIPLWKKKFIKLKTRNRVLWAGLFSFLTMLFYLVTLTSFFPVLNKEYWIIAANVLPIHVIGVMIIVILIEKIRANYQNRERYLQSERLNVISELSASVSHEIRNPLTAANGFLQLLMESSKIHQEEKKYLAISLQEIKRAEKIISDFLSFAKPQAENMVYSNFKKEIEYVNNIMIPYAHLHLVDLKFSFSNTLLMRFDQNQMQQCLINLYKNGIEAMKETGGILSIDVYENNGSILISITDTGIGMTTEECSLLGQPYYSTKKEGTGLGMVMIYSVIDKVGGTIKVKSEKDAGTTFLITLPV
ncbi:ATP-binding protein [Jeotgalibacillus sp. S-D1]|uniref:ATP-binding protein n=1 Tax=Jeotgalibacillus sp. S-D1 TaxID=2552189 RepID=UPI001F0E86C2|nr:ATP-binding protein [Jeotgalibacillus sp. S-D1]